MLPDPDTILHEPPAGLPINDTLLPSHTATVAVLFTADPGFEFTVNVASDVVDPQAPFAAIV